MTVGSGTLRTTNIDSSRRCKLYSRNWKMGEKEKEEMRRNATTTTVYNKEDDFREHWSERRPARASRPDMELGHIL